MLNEDVDDYITQVLSGGRQRQISLFGLMAGPSGIRAGWAIEFNGRFEAERPPSSAGPPSAGRAASSIPYEWH